MPNVAALFVDPKGIYPELLGRAFCWANEPGYSRDPGGDDARMYSGSMPVVCHSPCNLWTSFAAANYGRTLVPCPMCACNPALNPHCSLCQGTGRREPNRAVVLPAWYPGGTDGGCFASALENVRRCGGVIEQPAGSHAWAQYGLLNPNKPDDLDPAIGWRCQFSDKFVGRYEYVCEVFQSAYGHPCRKRTWLLYCGKRPPFELRWDRTAVATHQIGFQDRRGKAKNKPTLSGRAASATPRAFAEELIRLAECSTGVDK